MVLDEAQKEALSTLETTFHGDQPLVKLRRQAGVGFLGHGGEVVVLSFIFGAVSSGFFSTVGKDVWEKIKAGCVKLLSSAGAKGCRRSIIVRIEYKNQLLEANVTLPEALAEDPLALEAAVDLFWAEGPGAIRNGMSGIDRGSSPSDVMLTFEMDATEKKWLSREVAS